MVRRKSKILTEVEAEIMQILWKNQQASIQEICDLLENKQAYTTVATMLKILEKKDYIAHKTEGRQYIYFPIKDEKKAKRNILRYILDKFFSGSARALVTHLIQEDNLSSEQLVELRAIIEQKAKEKEKESDS